MRQNHLLFIFTFIIAFIQAPKPEGIQIFKIDSDSNKAEPYEITVLKDETFALQFERMGGSACKWSHSNDTFLKNSNYISFLNSSIWDYQAEEYQKELEEAKNSTSIPQDIPHLPVGRTYYYYELFKALDGGNQPQSLYFTFACLENIYQNVTVNIWICDEISKDPNEKCVIKKLCNNSLTEEECTSAKAANPKTSKCVYDKIEKKCKEEEKLCSEIKDGATKEICSSAKVSEANKTCVFDNKMNSCNEVNIAKNEDSNSKIKYIIALVSIFAIISIILSRILL